MLQLLEAVLVRTDYVGGELSTQQLLSADRNSSADSAMQQQRQAATHVQPTGVWCRSMQCGMLLFSQIPYLPDQ